ncbi:MAG: globin family protein [Deltaproteobacteria bacterium]
MRKLISTLMVAGMALAIVLELPACGNGGGTTGGGTTGGGTTGGSSGGTLYQKYGTAIPKVVDDAVTGLLADCVEAPYFGVVGEDGHDSVARLKGCLVLQFSALMGAPGVTYPGKNSEGDMCEDMATIHKDLGIPQGVFDQFLTDAAAVLAADGVASADITTIAGALTGLSPQIVSSAPVYFDGCDGGMGFDAGPGAGQSPDGGPDSLYQKYGGATGVGKVVGDAITGLLGDCIEAPYFAVVGQPGHDSLDRLAGCLDIQFGALFGGPLTYPSSNVHGDMCEDMTTIHANVGVPAPVFDQFITDLAGVLTADGVAASDIAAAAPALVGLKPQIVAATPIYHDGCDGGLGYNPDAG